MSNFTFELDDFAEEEFYNIVDYYKQFDQELSADFIQEFDQAVQQLIAFPKAGNPYLHQTRRVILSRFPYAIVYKIYEKNIVAHAVMHMRRKPDYWQERL
jgi:plasmid stabilization system protein ParE